MAKTEQMAPEMEANREVAEAQVSEMPAAESAPAQEAAPAAPATPAANRQPRRARRQAEPAKAVNPFDYMDGFVEPLRPEAAYQDELRHIEEIIRHNSEVMKTHKGDFRYIVAMMTGSDEARVNNDPNDLESVRIYGVEVMRNSATLGTLKLMFSSDDFTAYSNIERQEGETDSSLLRRQRQYTNHASLSKFQCVPVQIMQPEPDEFGRVGAPIVVCSRAFAMEQQQNKFFFGDEPLVKVGDAVPAYIMAANNNSVRVECMGLETRILRGQLTARNIVTDVSEYYKPGMAIEVVITELEIDKENRTVKLALSGVQREVQLGLVKNVKDFDLASKPREVGIVKLVTSSHYLIQLVSCGVIGIVARDAVKYRTPLAVDDRVYMEIFAVNEKYNRVIGQCVKV